MRGCGCAHLRLCVAEERVEDRGEGDEAVVHCLAGAARFEDFHDLMHTIGESPAESPRSIGRYCQDHGEDMSHLRIEVGEARVKRGDVL